MKARKLQVQMIRFALLLMVWPGAMTVAPEAWAQPVPRKVDNRFLLVFDTSAEMKRRVQAMQKVINGIFVSNVAGQLRSNDSIGVWTFDQQLLTGQFPLQRWNPEHAAQIASNLNTFVGSRRYSKKTGFDALIPLLGQVVHGSERLTVVIFCDGYGEMNGTPYDQGVNRLFQQRQSERQRTRQPIVIVLHSQLGQFVDCVVSFPPQPVIFPDFPPLPEPPRPVPKAAPPPPRPIVAPLIIIGTPVTNRTPPPRPVPPASSPPVPLPTVPAPVPANAAPPPGTAITPAGPPVTPEVKLPSAATSTRTGDMPRQLKIDAGLLSRTNAVSEPAGNPAFNRAGAFAMGAVSLLVVGLIIFLFGRLGPAKKE